MTNKRNIRAMWIISIIPTIILAFFYGDLPDIVPTNFGFNGEVNAYGPKGTMWILALICPLLAAMFQWLPLIDPKKHNYVKFQKYYDLFAIFTELFMVVVLGVVLMEIIRPGVISVGRVITLMISVLFLVVGNMMGKIKQNFYFGVKTAWTLSDPDVWTRTHSFCGKIWFAVGLLMIPVALFLDEKVVFIFLMCSVLCSVLLPFAYSYICYRQKHATDE